jgi:isoleucyl-tRNA synthetase
MLMKLSSSIAFTLDYNFCVVEMSSIYMDLLRMTLLRCERFRFARSSQTAMFKILDAMTKLLARYSRIPQKKFTKRCRLNQKLPKAYICSICKARQIHRLAAEEPKWEKTAETS